MAEYEEKDVKVDFFKTVFLISDKQLQDIGQKFQSVLITFDKCFKILENNISENIFQNYRLKCEKIKSLSKYATELARNGWLISYWFGLSEIDALSVIAYSNNF